MIFRKLETEPGPKARIQSNPLSRNPPRPSPGRAELERCRLEAALTDPYEELCVATPAELAAALEDVLNEVGRDAARFFFLMRKADSHLDFDLELAKRQSSDNPVFYVQYAHARVASLVRVAEEKGLAVPSGVAERTASSIGIAPARR